MAFATQPHYVDVIVDNSLKNIYANGVVTGYQFMIRLDYYRGQFLSVIDELDICVDYFHVPQKNIRFLINEKAFCVHEFDKCYTEFWNVLEPATIHVFCPGGLPEGDHQVEVKLSFQAPDTPLGPECKYMSVKNYGKKVLHCEGA